MLNFKKTLIAVTLSVSMLAPFMASADVSVQDTINQILAQIAALQAQIKVLQATQTNTGQFCLSITRNLYIGQTGEDVVQLSIALGKEGFNASMEEKGVFGENMAAAVVGFQEKYRDEILTPTGLAHGTGYVGPSTRRKLMSLYGCDTPKPIPSITVLSPNGGEAYKKGDSIQVSWTENYPTSAITLHLFNSATGVEYYSGKTSGSSGKNLQILSPEASNVPDGAYRITICDENTSSPIETGKPLCDSSDASFRIVTAEISKTISEQVKCVFNGGRAGEKCYTATDSTSPYYTQGCSIQAGQNACIVDLKGNIGDKITWKSSCGGYAYTTMDGQNEYAEFNCGGTTQSYTYEGQIFKKGDSWTLKVPPIQGATAYLMNLWNDGAPGSFWENNRDDHRWSYDGAYTIDAGNPKLNEAVCNSNVNFESRGYVPVTGWTDSRWIKIRVECPTVQPSIVLSSSPTIGPAPLAVMLTGTLNNLSSCGNTYTWDFGDGKMSSVADLCAGGISPTIPTRIIQASYTYQLAGTYNATLTVNNTVSNTVVISAASSTAMVNVTLAKDPVPQDVVAGTKQFEFADYNITASGGSVSISTLDVVLGSTNNADATSLTNCALYQNKSTSITTLSNSVNPTRLGSYQFHFDSPIAIVPGALNLFALRCDISTSTLNGSTYSWGLANSGGQTMTVLGKGSFTFENDPMLQVGSQATSGTTDVPVLALVARVTGEGVSLTNFKLQLDGSNIPNKITVWSGSVKIGEGVFQPTATSQYSTSIVFSTPLLIEKATSILVKADLSANTGSFTVGYDGDNRIDTFGVGQISGRTVNSSTATDVVGPSIMVSAPVAPSSVTVIDPNCGSVDGRRIFGVKYRAIGVNSVRVYLNSRSIGSAIRPSTLSLTDTWNGSMSLNAGVMDGITYGQNIYRIRVDGVKPNGTIVTDYSDNTFSLVLSPTTNTCPIAQTNTNTALTASSYDAIKAALDSIQVIVNNLRR